MCMTEDHFPSDYIKWWHGKLPWAWVCMQTITQLPRQRIRAPVMLVSPAHYGPLDVPAPGEMSAWSLFCSPVCLLLPNVSWRGRMKNNPRCRGSRDWVGSVSFLQGPADGREPVLRGAVLIYGCGCFPFPALDVNLEVKTNRLEIFFKK